MAIWRKVDGDVRIYSKWYDRISSKNFDTKKKTIQYYKSNIFEKNLYNLIVDNIVWYDVKSVIGFGSGLCVLEYLLKQEFPNLMVAASDYHKGCVDNAKRFFPEIDVMVFDFFKNHIKDVEACFGHGFDMAVMCSSAYAMDDTRFISFFKELFDSGICVVVDVNGGVIRSMIRHSGHLGGRVFGYGRRIGRYNEMYKESGFCVVSNDLIKVPSGSKYVAVLDRG